MSGISARRTNFKDLNTVFMLAWYGEYLSDNDNGIWESIFVQKTIASVNQVCEYLRTVITSAVNDDVSFYSSVSFSVE